MSLFSIGDTSSIGPFSIAMLVSRSVTTSQMVDSFLTLQSIHLGTLSPSHLRIFLGTLLKGRNLLVGPIFSGSSNTIQKTTHQLDGEKGSASLKQMPFTT